LCRDELKLSPKSPSCRPGRESPPEETIQETVEVPLEACPECGGPLEDQATHEQVQVDILEVWPVITRFRTESSYCRRCQKRVRSRQPRQVSSATGAAGVSLRPRERALAVDLKHRLRIPYRKVAELFRVAWSLEVMASDLCQTDDQLAEKAEPVYQELVKALQDSVAVHANETEGGSGGRGPGCGFLLALGGLSTPSIGAGPMRWWGRSWGRGFRACWQRTVSGLMTIEH
jgi:hypothetical protein